MCNKHDVRLQLTPDEIQKLQNGQALGRPVDVTPMAERATGFTQCLNRARRLRRRIGQLNTSGWISRAVADTFTAKPAAAGGLGMGPCGRGLGLGTGRGFGNGSGQGRRLANDGAGRGLRSHGAGRGMNGRSAA